MRAIQESVAKSRQAALERTLQRQAEEQAAKEELQQRDALRLKKERCFQARCDLIRAVNVAHEDDALQCLEEMHGHIDMLVATDEYGSTLLHEACSRGMFRLAMAVLDATTEEQERLFQTDYRGQTPLHRAATAGSGEICAALCKLPLCQKSLKDQDGFTALKIAQRWGFSAAADAIFRAINPMPELQVLAPPEPDIEETPVEKPTKGKLKPGKRGGSKERSSVATSTASSRKDLRSSVSRGSSKGFSRQVSARSSLKEEGRSVSRGSSQGKRGSLLRAQGQDRRTSGGASGRTSRMSSRQSSRQSSIQASRPASQHSGEDGRGSRKNSQDFEDQSNAEGLSDAEGSTGEPTSPEASQAENPEEDGLNSGSEEERPPPLPEDIGYQAGFKAVEENRLENALALARSSLWPFTNEVNPRGWTLLHVAAYHGLEELCAMMCQRKDFKGIDKPEKDFYATALHFAAGKRRPGCCNAIVQSGRCLDVNAKDNKGQTALHLAALRADRESYAAIAAHPDCNPLLPDNQGKSAAEYAADRGLEVDCQVPGHTEIDF